MELEYNKDLNGEQLIQELKTAGVDIANDNYPKIENNMLILDIAAKDEVKAKKVWESHIAEDWAIKKAEAKLALLERLGITEDEAKLLLS